MFSTGAWGIPVNASGGGGGGKWGGKDGQAGRGISSPERSLRHRVTLSKSLILSKILLPQV